MNRRPWLIISIIRVIFMWSVAAGAFFAQLPPPLAVVLFVMAFFTGAWLFDVAEMWSSMGRKAMQLADDAAAEMANHEGDSIPVIQITEVVVRHLPPRQMYASAIARESEPISMYRGWRVIRHLSLADPSETSTRKLSCRRVPP